jgi:glycosyltransferase involved in cell wall biosynthesis
VTFYQRIAGSRYSPEHAAQKDLQVYMTEHWLAVLGQRDVPTDGVGEYCHYLDAALSKHAIQLSPIRVPWASAGWQKAIAQLEQPIREMKPEWALIQYTALGWSRRGFPLQLTRMLGAIKKAGVRCAVVFHDPAPYPGVRLADRIRRQVQLYVMRRIARQADLAVLTIPAVPWLPSDVRNTRFIPVGANLPNPEAVWQLHKNKPGIPTIAVFSITGGVAGEIEVARITEALRFVSNQIGPVRLSVFGRNADTDKALKNRLAGTQIEVTIQGLLTPEEVVETLGRSDALLFVRGPISTRRGTALAGVACGLPVVAWEGSETGGPISEAGVVLVPENSGRAFGQALVRILQDDGYRRSLQERSEQAQKRYFSWDAIAAEYLAALRSSK